MNQPEPPKSITLKKWQLVLICILVPLLVAGGVLVGLALKNRAAVAPAASRTAAAGLTIDPNAKTSSDVLPKSSGASQAGIKIPGYPSIPLKAGIKEANIHLVNPDGNDVYFKFALVLSDTGEVLYQSGAVPPGQAINKQTLSRALSAGSYKAFIKISTFSISDQTPRNGANVETTLVVK